MVHADMGKDAIIIVRTNPYSNCPGYGYFNPTIHEWKIYDDEEVGGYCGCCCCCMSKKQKVA